MRNCEDKIASLEKEVEKLESNLADPDVYADGEKAKKLLADYENKKDELSKYMKEWEELLMKQEQIA